LSEVGAAGVEQHCLLAERNQGGRHLLEAVGELVQTLLALREERFITTPGAPGEEMRAHWTVHRVVRPLNGHLARRM